MIAIIDYGLGNIRAFANVYKRLNVPFVIASRIEALEGATKIILPGVGAFDMAMDLFHRSGMRERLTQMVTQKRVPILGVCVGMQMLARSSAEGKLPGLGWIEGRVLKFDSGREKRAMAIPHMGWNSVHPRRENRLLENMREGASFYFLHSYFFECRNSEDCLAETEYGGRFSSAVNSGNIYGVQFHPEKSHQNGIQLLKNFADLP